LVAVQLHGVTNDEVNESLDELGRLTKTLGLRTVGRLTQQRPSTGAATVLGAGKLKELAELTGGTGVVPSRAAGRRKGAKPSEEAQSDRDAQTEPDDQTEPEDGSDVDAGEPAQFVVFDQELSPTQLRNVGAATGAEVLDRTAVIVRIFERHARTREAKIQVEIARLSYLAPRARATGGRGDRQRGGIGGKGAGESALELDRRKVRDRIAELRTELAMVQRESDTRRRRRDQRATVALVGYTNAGKSSLMRGLTGSEVLVRDQLFATLDTTIRRLHPATKPPIFVSDTVGFIKKLPHDLLASFRSTLQEAQDASLLLNIVDASDPAWESQLEVTRSVLAEVGAADVPSLLVLNKVDRLDSATLAALAEQHPEAKLLSAHSPDDVGLLGEEIVTFFERDMVEVELFVSYSQGAFIHTIHEAGCVLSERHDEHGTRLTVRAPRPTLDDLRERLARSLAEASG
jgi:GTP-binding protein HflX